MASQHVNLADVATTPEDLDEILRLHAGTTVEVRRRFDRAWARGFEIATAEGDRYRLRRQSDGAVLPVTFPAADVRRSSGRLTDED